MTAFRSFSLAALLALSVSAPANAQFNPKGRNKRAPAPSRTSQPQTPAAKATENAPRNPDAQGSQDALFKRYLAALLTDPSNSFAVERLLKLAQENAGGTDALLAQLESKTQSGSHAEQSLAETALGAVCQKLTLFERADAAFTRALQKNPQNSFAERALAARAEQRGEVNSAVSHYENAARILRNDPSVDDLWRTLRRIALDKADIEQARRYQSELLRRYPASSFVRQELAKELFDRGQYAEAQLEYEKLATAAAADARVAVPLQRDLAKTLLKLGQADKACEILKKALNQAAPGSGLRQELTSLLVGAYRDAGKLTELARELERHADQGHTLAAIYEELGDLDRAAKIYSEYLRKHPTDTQTRLEWIRLLELKGEIKAAMQQYELLLRSAPRNLELSLRAARSLAALGEKQRALQLLNQAEASLGTDGGNAVRLADAYENLGEKSRALALLQKMQAKGGASELTLEELGSRYWEQGHTEKALQIWQQISQKSGNSTEDRLRLARIYQNHDLIDEALSVLEQAVQLVPADSRAQKELAIVLERSATLASSRSARIARYARAERIWENLLGHTPRDAALARDARKHMVTLWNLSGSLASKTSELERQHEKTPLQADRKLLLAESYLKAKRNLDAEQLLDATRASDELAVETLELLETVRLLNEKPRAALATLEKLVQLNPSRAREYLGRMIKYATDLYLDAEALRYAQRAVELAPSDAEAQRRLAEIYLLNRDPTLAIKHFELAISQNDRAFPVHIVLAELFSAQNKAEKAWPLLREVLQKSADAALLARAFHLALALHAQNGSLLLFERELAPLVTRSAERSALQGLMLNLYSAIADGLPDKPDAATLRELGRVREHALLPLVDALQDKAEAKQRHALALITRLRPAAIAKPLLGYAERSENLELKQKALYALGTLGSNESLAQLCSWLSPQKAAQVDEAARVAAAFSLVKLRDRRARPCLVGLLQTDDPRLLSLGMIGLSWLDDRTQIGVFKQLLAEEPSPLVRAAALFALGQLNTSPSVQELLRAQADPDPSLSHIATLVFAKLGPKPYLYPRVTQALLSAEPHRVSSALQALAIAESGTWRLNYDALVEPSTKAYLRNWIDDLVLEPQASPDWPHILDPIANALTEQAASQVREDPAQAERIAALVAEDAQGSLLKTVASFGDLAPIQRRGLEDWVQKLRLNLLPSFLPLLQASDAAGAKLAVQFALSTLHELPQEWWSRALHHPDFEVKRLALSQKSRNLARIPDLAEFLDSSQTRSSAPFALRAEAVSALGFAAEGSQNEAAVSSLERLSLNDDYALVREAALKSLARVGGARIQKIMLKVSAHDPEPRLREVAKSLAQSQ